MTAPGNVEGTATYCRSCLRRVLWRIHLTTKRSAPIDVTPSPDGNCMVGPSGYTVLGGAALAEAKLAGEPLHTSHFATCPKAAEHRR